MVMDSLLVSSSSLTDRLGGHGVLPCPIHLFPPPPPLKPSPHIRKPLPFLPLALKSPKGFGRPPPSPSPSPSPKKTPPSSDRLPPPPDQDDDDAVPEIVTNRMLKRMAFTIGIPLGVGVLFFPFFYYLKIVLKLDVPEWLPLLVSGLLFGTAAFGVSYGILSTSWDPLREGSLLGWKEAQANWPLFFQKGKQGKK